jgi:hypothetical protein
MRRLVLHVMVALLAFVVGVSAAGLLGGLTGHTRRGHYKRVHFERHGPPARAHDCPYSRGMSELPPLPPPAFDLPDAPAPPEFPPTTVPRFGEMKRLRIRGEDGKERVVVVQQSANVN